MHRKNYESSVEWIWQNTLDTFADFSPEVADSQNEITAELPEEQFEPLVLEESTNWSAQLGLSFEESYSPLVEPDPFPRLQALNDPHNRVGGEFEIPKNLYERTRFWFDIYTKHDSQVHVIHHLRYPWVVFKVIDTRQMVASGKGPLWLRRERAQKFVAKEKKRIAHRLKKLSKRRSFNKLSDEDKVLFKAVNVLPGKRSTVLRMSSRNVRSQLGQKDFFLSALKTSSRYLPYMEEVFVQQGLPVELTRLPFVESSFNIDAQSKVGASGIWQIMPRTGKAFLAVTKDIDERNAPLKATLAASRLLRNYNRSLKSWPLAVTGYNHGIGGVLKAKRKVGSNDLATIIRQYHRGSFRFASANFYTCFLAALYAEAYNDKLFPLATKDTLMERDIVKLSSRLRLGRVLLLTGLDKKTLLDYNLDLRNSASKNPWLPRGFELHLPTGLKHRIENELGQEDPSPKRRLKRKVS